MTSSMLLVNSSAERANIYIDTSGHTCATLFFYSCKTVSVMVVRTQEPIRIIEFIEISKAGASGFKYNIIRMYYTDVNKKHNKWFIVILVFTINHQYCNSNIYNIFLKRRLLLLYAHLMNKLLFQVS